MTSTNNKPPFGNIFPIASGSQHRDDVLTDTRRAPSPSSENIGSSRSQVRREEDSQGELAWPDEGLRRRHRPSPRRDLVREVDLLQLEKSRNPATQSASDEQEADSEPDSIVSRQTFTTAPELPQAIKKGVPPFFEVQYPHLVATVLPSALSQSSLASVVGVAGVNKVFEASHQDKPYWETLIVVAVLSVLSSFASSAALTAKEKWKQASERKNAEKLTVYRKDIQEVGPDEDEVVAQLRSMSAESIDSLEKVFAGGLASLSSAASGALASASKAQYVAAGIGYFACVAGAAWVVFVNTRVHHDDLGESVDLEMGEADVQKETGRESRNARIDRELKEWLRDDDFATDAEAVRRFSEIVRDHVQNTIGTRSSLLLSAVPIVMLVTGAVAVAVDIKLQKLDPKNSGSGFAAAVAGYLGVAAGLRSAVDGATNLKNIRRSMQLYK